MEVRIGVQHAAREITFESAQSADEIIQAVRESRTSDVLELIDDKGGRVLVPSNALGYVVTGAERKSAVGFGAH
ncbi:MAG: DUF3107 domain-containing protein [Dermatophilaceae bacterium]